MAWGLFRKIKKAIQDAGRFVKDKVIKPILKPENIKKAIDFGTKVAPLIGGAISTATTGNPMPGLKAGHIVQGIGLGYGK